MVVAQPSRLNQQSYVLNEAVLKVGDGSELTRNLDVVQSILLFLDQHIAHQSSILDLCVGTGICTTPLGQYYSVIAVEKDPVYRQPFDRYLWNVGLASRIKVIPGDIECHDTVLEHELVKSRRFDAAIVNPPFGLIPESLEIAKAVNPDVILGVLPLDVIEEAQSGESNRRDEPSVVEKDRRFIAKLREVWQLIAIEPFLRPDGTAQTGAFVFKRSRLTRR